MGKFGKRVTVDGMSWIEDPRRNQVSVGRDSVGNITVTEHDSEKHTTRSKTFPPGTEVEMKEFIGPYRGGFDGDSILTMVAGATLMGIAILMLIGLFYLIWKYG